MRMCLGAGTDTCAPALPFSDVPRSQTHDVVCVVRHEGLLCELQFSFRSVLLMKSFSHAGYKLSRVKLDAFGGFREMLDMAFDLPRLGTNSAGGYETRKPEDINLIVSFYE